ncbi:AI-2E family transporter [Dyadobacter arcticus]|uniref:PurR-regulated permease PerM n=1 Tax=Dyadobacter arcticus TaxID=1078754 RepID=A0ABX0UHZ9_9BACT|nr:AI-2E family transporter [Dyadobacter arcticus]NIJ52571.1 putative PurR-regulated permease PerM [Dyadobacter arcticus]
MATFNNRIRQIGLLVILAGLALLLLLELYVFIPGFLGALTLYILSREWYFALTVRKSWNKSATALLFMFAFLVGIGLPVSFAIHLISSQVNVLFDNSEQVIVVFKSVSAQIKVWTGQDVFTDENLREIQKVVTNFLPSLLNSSAAVVGNLLMILFLFFFMLTNGIAMERKVAGIIPLKDENVHILAVETKNMVRANAFGIPLISIIQGLFAIFGYWIFGIRDYMLWGFMTALFAFFPVVGTAFIWIPLIIFLYSSGNSGQAIGLAVYSLVVTGNVDYLARVTLLQKIGNVHPVVAVLGLIVGLNLFGFWGFIFGPLLISYFVLLAKIYANEFGELRH